MDIEEVQKLLDDAMEARKKAQARVLEVQKQLTHLTKMIPTPPKEQLSDLNEEIEKLEFHRITDSIPLNEEKQMLRKIEDLEKKRNSVLEYENHDKRIKETKILLAESRETLKKYSEDVCRYRTDVFKHKTAKSLGCPAEELEDIVVDCPADKVAHVIGKKGVRLKQIEEKYGVAVQQIEGESIKLVGPFASLTRARVEIDRIIASKEEIVAVPEDVSEYLHSKGIAALDSLQERHPHVTVERRPHSHNFRLKGPSEDIERAKADMLGIELVRRILTLPIKARSAIIGKEGTTVGSIVREHQATVEIKGRDSDENSSEIDVVVMGPEENLEGTIAAIHGILDENADVSQTIALEDSLKAALKINKGEGIKLLVKKVNDECRKKAQGVVSVNFADKGLLLKTRAKALEIAASLVESEIRRMRALTKKVEVDSFIVPAVFGKGGKVVKGIAEGVSGARVEVDRGDTTSVIRIMGWKEDDVDSVYAGLVDLLDRNKVKRIPLEGPRATEQYIKPMRTTLLSDLKDICFFVVDENKLEITIRGSADELTKASKIIENYFAENHAEVIGISMEEKSSLLNGGKSCKLVQLSAQFDVQLGVDKSDSVLTGKGRKQQVEKALKAVSDFLQGNAGDNTVRKITLDHETLGVALGKRGRTKHALESKYGGVKIAGQGGDTVLTVRGSEADVENCVMEILFIVATARLTRRVNVTAPQEDTLEENAQRVGQITDSLAVNMTVEDGAAVMRGIQPNVEYAACLVREIVDGVFESEMRLCRSAYKRVKKAFSANAHVKELEQNHSITIAFNEANASLVVIGAREDVEAAKREILKLLAFLLDDKFKEIEVNESDAQFVKNLAVVKTSHTTNTTVFYDRDVGRILVSGDEPACVLQATSMIRDEITKAKTLVAVLQMETSQQTKAILGKGGTRIQNLENRTQCRIRIDRDALTVTVTADTVEALEKGKSEIQKLLNKRKEKDPSAAENHVDVVDIETLQQANAIIGRGGSRVTDLEDRTKCRIRIDKKALEVTIAASTPVALENAKAEITKILNNPETGATGSTKECYAVIELEKPQQASLIIGKGGSRIQEIQNRTECEIGIDKEALRVTITAATSNALANGKAEVEKLLFKGEFRGSAFVDLDRRDIPAFIGRRGNRLNEFCKKHHVEMKVDDVKSQAIIGGETEAVESAVNALEEWKAARNNMRVEDGGALQNSVSSTIQLDSTEAWLASAIVGKGGGRIKRLRKAAGCRIDVDATALTVTVSAETEESLSSGLDVVQQAVEAERSRCTEVKMSPEKISAFIGFKGSHINNFEQLHDVKVKTQKGRPVLNIFGEPSAVELAKTAIDEWIVKNEPVKDGGDQD